MNPASLISVVIVNYNRKDDLRAAIASIRVQDYPNLEIIVVDNASTDGSIEMLKTIFPEVKSIPLARNIGMDGYSVACRAAKGSIIFQMDNDSLMPDTIVLSLVQQAFAKAPQDVAILATRVEEYRNQTDEVETLRRRDQRQGPLETLGYHSGGVAFRRNLMERVGYYNEDVFLYGAELFVQMNVLCAGFKILVYPEILMLHKSSNTARSKTAIYYETRNRYWFMRCYATVWQQARFLPWMLVHDFYYTMHKGALRQWRRAVFDGFGRLPTSLKAHKPSQEPIFQLALERIGTGFSAVVTLRRVIRRLCGNPKLWAQPYVSDNSGKSGSSVRVGSTEVIDGGK